jgi:molecular chaperone DnaJ
VKDYYLILEVPRDATKEDIRRAHRRLLVGYRPGKRQKIEAEEFSEIQAAYEVLSDSERRRDYNHQLKAYKNLANRQPVPEFPSPVSFWEEFGTIFPSIEEILDHIRTNFFGPTRKVEPLRELNLEVILDPDEAAYGVTFPIEMPVYHHCPYCNGRGGEFPFPCLRCDGKGWGFSKDTMRVRIPPGIQDGAVFQYPIQQLGIKNLWLTLTVRIQI